MSFRLCSQEKHKNVALSYKPEVVDKILVSKVPKVSNTLTIVMLFIAHKERL